MILSPQQERALDDVGRWFQSGSEQIFRLFGFAGTGKTTLTKKLVEGIHGPVVYGAFTGKAAYVMQTMGCDGATTLHSLIYTPKEKSQARLRELQTLLKQLEQQDPKPEDRIVKGLKMIEEERKNLRRPHFTLKMDSPVKSASLLVVDECSMVDKRMADDLLSFGTKILVLGDPAQLPPVGGVGAFIQGTPDVMLTEIHRQARDNPIIDLATRVREGEDIEEGEYGESKVIDWADIEPEMATGADQIICGTNKIRKSSNRRCRQLLGREGIFPVQGDKIVCLKNNHELGLLNGAVYSVDRCGQQDGNIVPISVRDEMSGSSLEVEAHVAPFEGRQVPTWEAKESDQFDYGYALTCHKAQGSQWKDVLIFNESKVFGKDRRKWLYTALTRASEKVTVVMP